MLRYFLVTAATLITVSTALGQHVHGEAELSIAIDGTGILLELHAPGESIVGFEHQPKGDAETRAVNEAISILRSPDLFSFSNAASCNLTSASADLEIDGEHSEFHVEHEFDCANTDAVAQISTNLFDAFMDIEEMHTEVSGPNGASSGDWESDNASFSL